MKIKSPLVQKLENSYGDFKRDENGERTNNKYLFVFYDYPNDGVYFAPVKHGQYPWAIHDAFVSFQDDDNYPAQLVMALNLDLEFDDQIPEAYHQIEIMKCFVGRPIIWIPNRNGSKPHAEWLKDLITPDRKEEFMKKFRVIENPNFIEL